MRSKVSALGFGVALVVLGVVLSGNTLGWWSADLFFDGWWTLFLIVPAIIAMIGQGPNMGSVIVLGVGALLLADARGALGGIPVWSLIGPIIIIAVGVMLLWKGMFGPKPPTDAEGRPLDPGNRISAVFSGGTAAYHGLPFTGAVTFAMFGGVELDLRGALITEDVLIDATTVFGGTEVIVSPGTRVELLSTGIFGGSESSAAPWEPGASGPVVRVRSTAIFGGLEVAAK
ncbi:MAG: hypothetical protein RBS17_08320 [Coriobacteriia bacterium]|nr:hypothetical protein [Coriobacteriia bacterium]